MVPADSKTHRFACFGLGIPIEKGYFYLDENLSQMRYKFLFTCLLIATSFSGLIGQNKQWVIFEDKGPQVMEQLSHPEAFLSPAALDRRAKKNIPVTVNDLPVHASYLAQLKAADLKIQQTSRWINAASINTELSLAELQRICPAIVAKVPVQSFQMHSVDQMQEGTTGTTEFDYGQATNQIEMIGADCLHDRGFTGKDVTIAVFDAGFFNMNTIAAFDSLRLKNRLISYYDFVDNDSAVFQENSHGMAVASIMVGNVPGQFLGSSPHASVLLARTEDVAVEVHQEEDNWLAAVEWADSMGTDMIESSLGYTEFDPGEGDYTYADMDGNTTIIAKAADLAAQKGILVVVSAGNLGGSSWGYLSSPCDADSVLCVGAVDGAGQLAFFSSVGPSSDGQIKPDVVGLGLGTTYVNGNGNVTTGNGTSFSAPLIAGMAACLVQAHPLRSNVEIIQAIQQSGDRAATPDTSFGYGVPNACVADSILTVMDSVATGTTPAPIAEDYFRFFPNPVTDVLNIEPKTAVFAKGNLQIISANGQVVMEEPLNWGSKELVQLNLEDLSAGIYILKISAKNTTVNHRFIRP